MDQDNGASASHEEWRAAPGHLDYIVSSLGRVRHTRVNAPILRGDVDRYGYRRVLLNGKRHKVHRLVCMTFHGPQPEGCEAGHLDGQKSNNRKSNLAWVTHAENEKHKVAHGTHAGSANLIPGQPRGEANPSSKLTTEIVRAMRQLRASGYSERLIATEFGVSPSQTHKILVGEAWSHV